jgi:hypothetical protein
LYCIGGSGLLVFRMLRISDGAGFHGDSCTGMVHGACGLTESVGFPPLSPPPPPCVVTLRDRQAGGGLDGDGALLRAC